jgi:peptidoglycan/LPS O-acetylase OafA/YrhL
MVRPDIQGLRMLAVMLVIANHILGWPSGGFVGVDVFFVISGFLITGLLQREQDRDDSISLADFYRRRVRRIIPMAVLVAGVTVIASWIVFSASRAATLTWDAIWSVLFVGNWRFALEGTDYFNTDAALSPLQQYWSLGVEEQFYIVWPWIVILAAVLASTVIRRRQRAERAWLLGIMAGIVVASFAWAVMSSATDPTVAYFSTLTRAWELGLGGLLAVGGAFFRRLPMWSRPLLAWIGLAGIIVSAIALSPDSQFPGPWAAAPTLATVLVIAAGIGSQPGPLLWPLTNRVSTYVGDISYSLFLWHLPVASIGGALLPFDGWVLAVTIIAITFALAALSYHFIEDPIRKSTWLEPKRRRARHGGTSNQTALKYAGLTAMAIVTALLVLVAWGRSSPHQDSGTLHQQPVPAAEDSGAVGTGADEFLSGLNSEIQAALAADAWPDLDPPLDTISLENSAAIEWTRDNCLGQVGSDAEATALRCVYGDPESTHQIAVLGDSVAIGWVPAIRAAVGDGWGVHLFTLEQCPAADIAVKLGDGAAFPQCDAFRQWALDQIAALRPEAVIMSTTPSAVGRLASGAQGAEALAEWSQGTEATAGALAETSGKVLILAPPPAGATIASCYTSFSTPSDCEVTVPADYAPLVRSIDSAVDGLGASNVQSVHTVAWFCSFDRCPAFIGPNVAFAGGSHLTNAYSLRLGPIFESLLSS